MSHGRREIPNASLNESPVRATVGESRADSVLSLTTAVSMGLLFVTSPLLRAMTDRSRRRMPFLIASTVLCVALTLTMGRMAYWPTLIAFVLANTAYPAGLQFYDALLLVRPTIVGLRNLDSYFAVGIGRLRSYKILSTVNCSL